MAGSDFTWISFNHTFNGDGPSLTKTFSIEAVGKPIDNAYLLIQVRSVSVITHSIEINGQELPSFDLVPAPSSSQAWLLWMDRIPPNFLKSGQNDIRITRKGNDNFEIGGVVVNWRENR
jgi:hypothetical protein